MRTEMIFSNSIFRMGAVSLLVGVLLAVAGAFQTNDLSLLVRLAYWIITIFLGNLIAFMVGLGLDKIKFLYDKTLVYHFLHLIIISTLITFFVVGVNSIFFGTRFSEKMMANMFPAVFIISSFMTIVHLVLSRIPLQSHSIVGELGQKRQVLLFERLPFKFKNATIYAINSEDHYLRIHTNVGDTMILMRLYDAIKELEGVEGSQTHRSWWVAKDAITEVVRIDGRINFRLKNNEIAPVSRSFQGALKAQNWL